MLAKKQHFNVASILISIIKQKNKTNEDRRDDRSEKQNNQLRQH